MNAVLIFHAVQVDAAAQLNSMLDFLRRERQCAWTTRNRTRQKILDWMPRSPAAHAFLWGRDTMAET